MATLLILQDESEIDPGQLDTIRELARDYDIWTCKHPEKEDPDRLKDVEISGGFKPPKELILNGRLKWHHAFSAGMDWMFSYEDHLNLPMVLTNSSGIHAVCMSEHTLAMILAYERSLPLFVRNQEKHHWQPLPRGGRLETIAGKTMLILGLGAIGERLAKLAKALDMRIIGVRRQPELASEWVDEMVGQDHLDEKLPESDYIVCLLPNTPDTHHILGAKQFEVMKKSAFVVNLGRGVHVDEVALAEALQAGKIRAAALDTFETEPLPADSPLWSMENVLISPHCAGFQPDYGFEARKLFIRNLEKFLSEKPLINVVDKQYGYSLKH